jgi:hypothetical protein
MKGKDECAGSIHNFSRVMPVETQSFNQERITQVNTNHCRGSKIEKSKLTNLVANYL